MPTRKILAVLGIIAAVLVAFGGLALARNGADDPAGDVRGNCDEAEHADDPGCTTTTTAGDDTTTTTEDDEADDVNDDHGVDDEADDEADDVNDDQGVDEDGVDEA